MKTFRNVIFTFLIISFIVLCIYYYLNEISSKVLIHLNFYNFTILEMLMAVMGAFYMVITFITLLGYLIYGVFSRSR
jgi:hypothetical protein